MAPHASPASPQPTHTTTFFLANIHCLSCSSNITTALSHLTPAPLDISISIFSHTVTISHLAGLSLQTIVETLRAEGYEIDSVVHKPHSSHPVVVDAATEFPEHPVRAPSARRATSFSSLRRLPSRQSHGTLASTREERLRRRHRENCAQCREDEERAAKDAEASAAAAPSDSSQEVKRKTAANAVPESESEKGKEYGPIVGPELEGVVVDDGKSQPSFTATLAVEGMTCASCVGTITAALEEKAWVRGAQVNLLTGSAIVKGSGGEERAKELVNIVEDAGYEASIDDIKVEDPAKEKERKHSDVWMATYAIGGMTCSSCVGAISEAVKELDWVKSVDINLIGNSGTVVFEGMDNLPKIQETIEDIGYEAKLQDVSETGDEAEEKSARTASIRVDGMYCEHCQSKIRSAVDSIGRPIEIEKLPTAKDPVLRVTYEAKAPDFTIRTILSVISDADPAFEASIFHPMTMEERARLMQKREQRHILYRIILSLVVAIPTFIIGIVYMTLLPEDNSGKMYLMHPLRGVSRAEWALLVLSTVVYFFAADTFHKRTFKELRALWRPGSPTPLLRRFYRFGSMNMLISLGTTIAYFSSIVEIIIAATAGDRSSEDASNQSYFDSVVFLTMFILLGRLIEAYSKAKTGDAISALSNLRPTTANLVTGSTGNGGGQNGAARSDPSIRQVPVDHLDIGDIVRILPGGSPPCDAVLLAPSTTGTNGEASSSNFKPSTSDAKRSSHLTTFDESSLTGESRPVGKSPGDALFAGTVNVGGTAVSARITGAAGSSLLDNIMRVVREGQARRAPVERVADAVTGYFVPVVTAIAIIDWIIWVALGASGAIPEDWRGTTVGGWAFWGLRFAIAVFVIACPCGIGLAAPTALFVGGGLAAKFGILVKGGGEAFQEASKLSTMVFDKTGTLTKGELSVTDHERGEGVEGVERLDEGVVLSLVKTLEEDSSHPIAKAIVEYCKSRLSRSLQSDASSSSHDTTISSAVPQLDRLETSELAGRGMLGTFTSPTLHANRKLQLLVGNEALLADHSVTLPAAMRRTLRTWQSEAKSVVLCASRILPPNLACSSYTCPAGLTRGPDGSHGWDVAGAFAVSDPLREEASEVVAALRKRGVDVWIVSGDNVTTAEAVGRKVGVKEGNVIAGVMPEMKAVKVKELQEGKLDGTTGSSGDVNQEQTNGGGSGTEKAASNSNPNSHRSKSARRRLVAMVGDGINDSPALTTSDVGIAMGSGSDVAVSAAKFVLVTSDLRAVLTLLDLSRAVFRRIKFNFGWALVYNVAAMPIAAGVLYPVRTGSGQHVRLPPVWAAVAMAASSVSVVTSSLMLRTRVWGLGFRGGRR